MVTWNPSQYGTFIDSRTRPSRDLALQVDISAPQRIVDLGCGPGNSTAVCAERWPSASILGLDSSPEMIQFARAANPEAQCMVGDIGDWARESDDPERRPDLIFSCAALQWVDDHADVFPRLIRKLAPGGILAAHMPDYDAIPNRVMRQMAAHERWRRWFPEGSAKEWRSHALEFYYEVLGRCSRWMDLWSTDYLQIMPNVNAIVEWYKSTGLRPYLDRIRDESQRQKFLDEYTERLAPLFPESKAGGVPFLFRRLFIIAAA